METHTSVTTLLYAAQDAAMNACRVRRCAQDADRAAEEAKRAIVFRRAAACAAACAASAVRSAVWDSRYAARELAEAAEAAEEDAVGVLLGPDTHSVPAATTKARAERAHGARQYADAMGAAFVTAQEAAEAAQANLSEAEREAQVAAVRAEAAWQEAREAQAREAATEAAWRAAKSAEHVARDAALSAP